MNTNTTRQVVVVLAIAATIIVNLLANALPIGGRTTGDISDSFEVFFVPAGYVFAIWGLIYVGLIAFAVYQALPDQRDNPRLVRIRDLVVVSCLANIVWIFLWHNVYFVLTLVAMGVLLVSLIAIYQRLDIGRARPMRTERWAVDTVFSVYLGWISVATIANVTVVLSQLNWSGWGISPEIWAMIMLGVGVVLVAAMAATRDDVAYPLVLAWAFAGIGVSQAGTTVSTVAWLAAIFALLAAVFVAFTRWRGPDDLAPV